MPEVELDTEILLLSNSAIKAQKMHETLRNGVLAVTSRIFEQSKKKNLLIYKKGFTKLSRS